MPSAHDHVHKQLTSTSGSKEQPAECPTCAAGIYSSSEIMPLLADIFEDETLSPKIPLERLEGFASRFGRDFYKEPIQPGEKDVVLERRSDNKRLIPEAYSFVGEDGEQEYIRPFYAGKEVSWHIRK
jgi:dihydroorotase